MKFRTWREPTGNKHRENQQGIVWLEGGWTNAHSSGARDFARIFDGSSGAGAATWRYYRDLGTRQKLAEALEQKTATSEVLRVISSSPGELKPVFEVMLENATRICAAKFGTMYRYDGEAFHVTAMYNAPPAFEAERRRAPIRPPAGTALAQTAATRQVTHIYDIREQQSYLPGDPYVLAGIDAGYRTLLVVPMLKNNELIGTISSSVRWCNRSPTSRSR